MYDCGSWAQVRRFPIDTVDAASLHWAPDSSCVAIVDDPLHYKLFVHKPDGGCLVAYQVR